jgi:hypothetical protein
VEDPAASDERMVDMSKGWKLGIGIPLLLLGLVLAGTMGLVLSFLGTDGRFTSPELRAAGDGVAIVAEDIRFEDLPEARETFTQLQGTIRVDLRSANGDIFVGIAPAAEAEEYLDGAAIDVVTDLEPLGVRTRTIAGKGDVEPPGAQDIWVVSTDSERPLEWTLLPGDWWLVVMNVDGSAGVTVAGTAAVEVPVVGAVVIVLLVVGLALLAGGLGFIISATRSRPRVHAATPAPPPPVVGGRPAPPRPDAFG